MGQNAVLFVDLYALDENILYSKPYTIIIVFKSMAVHYFLTLLAQSLFGLPEVLPAACHLL